MKAGESCTQELIKKQYAAMFSAIARFGKNSPIQGTGADMLKIAVGCGFGEDGQPFMWHKLEPEFGAKLVNVPHDEVVVEAPQERAQEAFDFVSQCMTRAGAELVKSVPMTTEGGINSMWRK